MLGYFCKYSLISDKLLDHRILQLIMHKIMQTWVLRVFAFPSHGSVEFHNQKQALQLFHTRSGRTFSLALSLCACLFVSLCLSLSRLPTVLPNVFCCSAFQDLTLKAFNTKPLVRCLWGPVPCPVQSLPVPGERFVTQMYAPQFLSCHNQDLKLRTLKALWCVTALGYWIDCVIALRSRMDHVIALR